MKLDLGSHLCLWQDLRLNLSTQIQRFWFSGARSGEMYREVRGTMRSPTTSLYNHIVVRLRRDAV